MARQTKEEAERTREAVLDAAERVFLERGVGRATLEDVARAAGFTRGAVHWHFGDKPGLFNALAERVRLVEERVARRIAAEGGPDPLENLGRAVLEALAGLEADPRQRRSLTVLRLRCEYTEEMAPALDRQRAADALLREATRRAFADAAARGRLAPGWEPGTAALAFHALVGGLVDGWLRGEGGFSLTGDGAEAIRAFLGAVAAGDPARDRRGTAMSGPR
jgi:AcrR family transcriptional regulator